MLKHNEQNIQHAPAVTTDYLPDFHEILMTLWRHKRFILLVTLVSFFAGAFLVLLKQNAYTATATLLIQDNSPDLSDFTDVTATEKFDDMTLETEVKVLNSPTLAQKTIDAMELFKAPEFQTDPSREKALLYKFLKRLSVTPQKSSRVIGVSFTARDPELAATVVNTHIKAYFAFQIAQKEARITELSQWFETKVRELKENVEKKSQAVAAYRARENLIVGEDDQELVYKKIALLGEEISKIQAERLNVQSKLQTLSTEGDSQDALDVTGEDPSGLPAGDLEEVGDSMVIQQLKVKASTLADNVASLQASYGRNHPKLRAAYRELAQVNEAIRTEKDTLKSNLKTSETLSLSQEDLYQEQLAHLQSEASTLQDKMIVLSSLKVEEDASKKLLDNFLQNYETIQSQVSFARPDANVISPAVAPAYPNGPGTGTLMLVVLIFSGFLALALVFLMEVTRSGIRNFTDLRNFGQTPLGILPAIPNPLHAVLSPENSSYRESLKRIYMAALLNTNIRSVLITSALPREGRTTFTASLAYYLLSIGHSVLVVDADFMNPALSRLDNTASPKGFTDIIAGTATLKDVLLQEKNGLTILPAGQSALFSPDVLNSEKFHALMKQLKAQYHYVLVDAGPALAHAEAKIIAEQTDGVLVLVEWLKTARKNVANMLSVFAHSQTPILGIVINKVDLDKYKAVTSGSDFLIPKF